MSYTSPQLIYFLKPIGMEGPIKIGCSSAPEKRLAVFAAWSPFPLEIAATAKGNYKIERALHDRFAHLHTHLEWFKPDLELTSAIRRIAAGTAVEDAIDLSVRKGSIRDKRKREPWSPERRRLMSWTTRIHAANRRAARHLGCQMWIPERAWDLMQKMGEPSFTPSSKEIEYSKRLWRTPSSIARRVNSVGLRGAGQHERTSSHPAQSHTSLRS